MNPFTAIHAVQTRATARSRLLVLVVLASLCVGLVATKSSLADVSVTHATGGKSAKAGCKQHPRARGSVRFSDWQFPDTLNPYQTNRLVSQQIDNALFEHLFRYDNHGNVTPQLASTTPTTAKGGIRDGGRTVIVHLRQGVRWSNGAEITSKDVQFGWRVGLDPATGPDCLGSCDAIKRIDLPGRYTAVIRLKRPYSSAVPSSMPDVWPSAWPHAWKDNPHQAALRLGQDPAFNFEKAGFPTNGPYQVAKFVNRDRIEFRPMKYYAARPCQASIKSLTFLFFRSKADMISAAAAGKTDITTDYTATDLKELGRHRSAYRIRSQTSLTLEHLEFNLDKTYRGKVNPLADIRVRQALALALDKSSLVRSALDVTASTAAGLEAWTPYLRAPDVREPLVGATPTAQWDPLASGYVSPGSKRALADARRLLGRTKFKSGFTLDLYTTTGSPFRQAQEAAVAASWGRLKVKVNPNYVSDAKLLAPWEQGGIATHGRFQVAMFAYLGSPDPDSYRFNLQSKYCNRRARIHSTLNGNNSCIQDGLIDRNFKQAARSLDSGTRASDYAAIGARLNRQAYWIPLYFRPSISTDDGRVVNFSNNPTQLGNTWNIEQWRVK